MARVKRSAHGRKHRKAVLEQARGYYGDRSRSFRTANEAVLHAGQYAFRDRRARKGEFRRLWIQRINAASRAHGLSYSRLIAGLTRAGVEVDRRLLADLAVTDDAAFGALVEVAQKGLAASRTTLRRLRRLAADRAARWEARACVLEGPDLVTAAVESGAELAVV